MKTSVFNIFAEKDKNTLCYNTLSENMVVLPNDMYKDFCVNQNNLDTLKISNLELYNALVDNDFIISKSRNEINEIRLANKISTISSIDYHLTLIPSLDCNLKCWYCYENHRENSRMSPEIIDSIVKHIKLKIEKKELGNLVIDWFGGEPLLFFDEATYPLSIKLKEVLKENDLVLDSFFVTNGSLINDKMIEKLNEINSRFQITLDGNEKRHDQIRFTKKSNNGTYRKLIDSIYNIATKISNTYVNIRINYDEQTLKDIEDILNDLINIDRKKVNIHLERIWQTKPNPNNPYLKRALDLIVSNGFSSTYLNFSKRNYRCKAERLNQAVIIYDGSVYKCSGRDFTKENCDGLLKENGEIEWNKNNVASRIGLSTFENQMCIECKLLPICMGPCSQKSIEHNWTNLDHVCPLKILEIPIDDFIIYKYNNVSNIKKIYNV